MQITQKTLATGIVLIGLTLAAIGADRPESYARPIEKKIFGTNDLAKASDLIGKEVRNAQGDDLGKVQDLIVSLDTGSVPYAIIAHGGLAGIGRTKTAVTASSLQCSGDGKTVMLSATKEELKAASKSPPEGWTYANGADWTKGIDGFYGVVPAHSTARYERQAAESVNERRQFTRERSQQGAAVDVTVENGVATVHGHVDNAQQKRDIESKLKTVPGIKSVDNQLNVRNY